MLFFELILGAQYYVNELKPLLFLITEMNNENDQVVVANCREAVAEEPTFAHSAIGSKQCASRRVDLANVALLSALWVAMVALVHPAGEFPIGDDWVYALSVKSILETGRFQLLGWSQTTAFPQAYLGAMVCRLFGFSFTALRFSTLVLGLGGIVATYSLLRELKSTPSIAMLGATTVTVNPLYFYLANSFLSDVPFYFFSVTSLFMWVRGLHRNSTACLVLGAFVSCLAILTRQFGFALPLGFAAAYLLSRPVCFRTALIAVAPFLIGLALHLFLQQWMATHGRISFAEYSVLRIIDQARVQDFSGLAEAIAGRNFYVAHYAGLFVLPSALLMFCAASSKALPEERRRTYARMLMWVAIFSAVVILKQIWMPFTTNVLTYFGFGPLTLRDTYILKINLPTDQPFLHFAWVGITGLAILGAAFLMDRCWRVSPMAYQFIRAQRRGAVDAASVLLTVSGVIYVLLITVIAKSFFDRYILFCIPFALALVSKRSDLGGSVSSAIVPRCFAWLLVTMSACFSLVAMHDYLAFNQMRWQALHDLTERQGVPPKLIDGGFEFNGWLLNEPGGPPRNNGGKSWWWVKDDEYVVAMGPIAGYQEIASYPFKRWLLNEVSRVVVLKRESIELP